LKAQREVKVGIIGCGLMGRELASAAARWMHLTQLDCAPKIVAVCALNPAKTQRFAEQIPSCRLVTNDYHALLDSDAVEALYVAVPHNLHQQVYGDVIRAGKHLLGEKPFGIDLPACQAIAQAAAERPDVLVRCSSEFPFFPGPYRISRWMAERRFGQVIEFEAGFWHSSDLDPDKAINWKRMIDVNGEYGCLGDLGMHVCHLPFRLGWYPRNVRALLSNIVTERPDKNGDKVPCATWDNAMLCCEASNLDGQEFPMLLSTKRIAPGEGNTWFVRVMGTEFSAMFTTKNPKEIRTLAYTPGGEQAWQCLDLPHSPPYPTITGSIFEFGFSDALLQMFAAFIDELVHGADGMQQPFTCVTLEEALASHRLFTAALRSQRERSVVEIE
jgi:predicted dehydrogenase